MITKAADQTKGTMCISLFNRELHKRSICPGNHEVCYSHGWFYFDGKPSRRPELTAEADRLLAQGVIVYYSPTWNTYVITGERE